MIRLYHAAKLAPILSAMYGPKDAVTDYPLGNVLTVLGLDHDGGMLEYWTGHHYSKIMEGRAKARRGK